MVQSPLREDAKWENTGLRAGEAETEKVKKAGCKETHCLPGSVVTYPDKENTPYDPQSPAHTKLHFNDLGMKDSPWNYLWSSSNHS